MRLLQEKTSFQQFDFHPIHEKVIQNRCSEEARSTLIQAQSMKIGRTESDVSEAGMLAATCLEISEQK